MPAILIIDDEAAIRQLLERQFRSAGFEVLVAGNGLEALDRLGSTSGEIDLIISDVKMPLMNGVEAVQKIREIRPDVGVIFMTGYSDEDLPTAANVISKPFRTSDMLTSARRVLSDRQAKVA